MTTESDFRVLADPDEATSRPPRASARDWVSLAVLALPCMVYAMDLTVLNLALPRISEVLLPSASELLWIVDIYGFFVAGFLITMGNIGDRYGRRRILLIGALAFTLASIIAAFASDATMLIIMRALLGIAGATVAPSTLSLIRNIFHDPGERQFAIGIWITAFSVGSAVGPLVGGFVLQYADWPSIFLVAVPVMVALLVLGPFLLPEYRDPAARPIDAASVLLSLAAILTATYGLKKLAEAGPAAVPLLALLIGFGLGAVFIRRQRRLAHPLLDLSLFDQPRFRAAIAAYSLGGMAMMGLYILITQYLQLVLMLTPLQAGLSLLPWSLGFVVGSLGAPMLTRRMSPVTAIVRCLLVGALGFVVMAFIGPDRGVAVLVAATTIMSLGLAPVFTLGNEIILTAAPPERAGAASAVSETSGELSAALGIALLGSLGMALYRTGLDPALLAAIPDLSRVEASATLGATWIASQGLPTAAGLLLFDDARVAFTNAVRVIALIGAALLLLASLIAARILRMEGSLAARA